ncbi:MAG: restriction endonuclease subunit S [Verrucomicrobiia bacterium]
MKNGWQTKKLGEVCELVNGRAYSKPELLADGKYRVLRVGNFFTNDHWYFSNLELDEKKYCDTGDLLYAWSASFGPRIWTGGKVIYHYHIWKVIHDRSQIDQKFLFYFFEWDTEKIKEDQGTGTTMMHVSMGSMNDRDIQFPSLSAQNRIASILDEAFAGLVAAKANAEKNLQNARALFESHLQSIFALRGKGWVEKKLGDLSQINYGYTESASWEHVGPKFLRITDIQDNGVDWSSVPSCPIDASDFPKYKLADGDIVFARTGATTGKSYLVTEPPDAVFASYLIRMKLSTKELLPQFVNLFFQTPSYWDRIKAGVSGSAQGGFNATKLAELLISFPQSEKEQKQIVAKLEGLSEETERLAKIYEQKLSALEELKKSLLHHAFTGQL